MELTGRENIFMNGAILGMRRHEIRRKFDEIVNFSEVEEFLDTPVKRYSSGMFMRLAFAVAAHLEPEILMIDEVLAVGDAAFQKKCLGKMGDVAKQGRTVLFVSHNMEMVQSLCERAFLLDAGKLIYRGTASDVVDHYLQTVKSLTRSELTQLEHRQDRSGDGSAKIVSLKIEDADGHAIIRSTSRLKLTIGYRSERPIRNSQFSATIYDYNSSIGLISLHSERTDGLPEILPPEGEVTCVTEPLCLTPGRCHVNITLLKGGARADYIQHAAYFDVEAHDIYGSGKIPERDWVVCLRKYTWSAEGH
jgi:lipopolysaccharide transport system ATP-binding protein